MAFSVVEDLYGDLEMIVFPKTFVAYSGLLSAGNIILVDGKISVKDDQVKLIAEKISQAPKTTEGLRVATENSSTQQTTSNKKKGAFLRVDSQGSSSLDSVKNLLSIFEGDLPVYVFYKDTQKYEFLGKDLMISINKPLKNELDRVLGEENVVIRE
jgi:DNA polymerase-3 subunit alpha